MSKQIFLTSAQISRWAGVTVRRVQILMAERGVTAVKGQGYPASDVIRALYLRRHELQTKASAAAAGDARLKNAQADLRQLDLEQRRGQLVAIDAVDNVVRSAIVAHCAALDAAPVRLSTEVANKDARECLRVLRPAFRDLRQGLADSLSAVARSLEAEIRRRDRRGKS